MTDTHTHLYLQDYEDGGKKAVETALKAGVGRMVLPNVDLTTVDALLRLHKEFPSETFVAAGLHPTEIDNGWKEAVDKIFSQFRRVTLSAIGEVGIDLYWKKDTLLLQQEALLYQIEYADSQDLPLIIHCRDGLNEFLEVIQEYGNNPPRIVMHSFTGSVSDVHKIRKYIDPYFGINGVVTFKNAESLRLALPDIGISRILTETDSPYLAPMPYRGKRNESFYIPLIIEKISEIFGMSTRRIADETDNNASLLFKI